MTTKDRVKAAYDRGYHKGYKDGYGTGSYNAVMDATDGKAAQNGYELAAVVRCENCAYHLEGKICRIYDTITGKKYFCNLGKPALYPNEKN